MKNEIKCLIFILTGLIPRVILGQQFPLMDGYNSNPFSLSPAYAGIHGSKILFIDYRSDWSGLDGSPKTYQLTYNDKPIDKKRLEGKLINDRTDYFWNKVGFGGRFIYDKTDIFKQILILGTYTYEVKIAEKHRINFGLSAGFFMNSVDLDKYYNDPRYSQDKALFYDLVKSKVKFSTDVSALYRYQRMEAGILFSNILYGTERYRNTDMTYKPLKNYLLHASYLFEIDNKWSARPLFILRGGQNIPVQLEIIPTITWKDRFWGTTVFRTSGVCGIGAGGEIYDGIILNYSYYIITNVSLYPFGSHQLSLGIRIFDLLKNKKIKN